jgi:Uri superfamily endonuclease
MRHPTAQSRRQGLLPDVPESDQGIYVLLIHLPVSIMLSAGALPPRSYPRGTYWYVGSAQRNLRSRIFRHLRTNKPTRWHIDYFLTRRETKIEAVFTLAAGKSLECSTAGGLGLHGEVVRGFGASDCRCPGHLIRTAPSWNRAARALLQELGFAETPVSRFTHNSRERHA